MLKKRLISVVVRLILSFLKVPGSLQSAVLGSVKHASKLHESTLLEKALGGSSSARDSNLGFVLRRAKCVPRGTPEKRNAVILFFA